MVPVSLAGPDVGSLPRVPLGDWPTIGRDEELAVLTGAMVDRGRSVVIAGPPGVGKTRLAREAVARMSEGGTAHVVTATRSAATTPLGALLGLLDGAALGERGDASDRAALFRRASRALRGGTAAGDRLVIGIDDAHLLDEVSAALVHQLVEQRAALVVVTLRSGEAAPDAVTALWRDDLAERIELQPLARDDVRALLHATLPGADDEGTANRVWKATGGNLLYLRELVREALRVGDLHRAENGWAWDGRCVRVGPRLREVVAGSLVHLPPAERALLDVLALGEPLPSEVLHEVDAAACDSCERRGLVVVDRSGREPVLRLHHPMLGDVLRADMTDADRRRLSARLADLPGVAAVEPLRTAIWQVDAGRTPSAELLVSASTAALHTFDPVLAARLAGKAVDAGGGRDALLALARAHIADERYTDAESVLQGLEPSLREDDELVEVARLLSDVRFWGLGRPDEADAGLVATSERVAGDAARLSILALRASVRNDAGDIDGALALTTWATDPAVDAGARMRAVTSAASALTLSGRALDALAMCDELLPVALERSAAAPRDVGRVLAQRIHALVGLARLDEAQDTIVAIHAMAADAGDDEVQGGAALVLGQLSLERGLGATAATWLREAATVLGRFDPQHNLAWCLSLQAWAAALAGDAPGADEFATAAEQVAATAPVGVWAVRVDLARAHAAAVAGELTRAGHLAQESADRLEAQGNRYSAAGALDAAVVFGAPAAPLADRLEQLSVGVQVPWMHLWRDHARAVATRDGTALEAVGDRFAQVGARLRAAQSYQAAAVEHARAGRRSSAVRARGRAASHLASCDGVRLPSIDGAGDAVRLTRREREIASLAAGGLSNQEIADRLSVGVRTVEGHLLRASTKLGVRRRGELDAALRHAAEPA